MSRSDPERAIFTQMARAWLPKGSLGQNERLRPSSRSLCHREYDASKSRRLSPPVEGLTASPSVGCTSVTFDVET